MSNEVYPVLRGVMPPRGRIVLPPPVTIRTTPSQREYAAADASVPRYQYALAYEWLATGQRGTDLATLLGFYNRHGGPLDSWLYDDPDDNTATASAFGIGDGTTTSWRLLRSFGAFSEPVDAVGPAAVVSVNGVPCINALANSSFEVDSNADGLADALTPYSAGTSGSVTYSLASGGSFGSKVQRVDAANLGTTEGDRAGVRWTAGGLTGLDGSPVTLSAYALIAATGSPKVRLFAQFFSGAGSVLGNIDSGEQAGNAGAYQRYSVSGTVPAGTASAQVWLWMSGRSGAAGFAEVNFDAAQLEFAASASAYSTLVRPTIAWGTAQAVFASAPAIGAVLTWSGKFYRRCRFLGAQLDTERFLQDLFRARRVEFVTRKT